MSSSSFSSYILKAKIGFKSLTIDTSCQKAALKNLTTWLSQPQFSPYHSQIHHLINHAHWDYLLDCFYQIIPFGTGGRRGEVGIGPNRINPWTIQSSAQGHSQYLLKHHGAKAKKQGIVLAFDIRQFFGNKYLNNHLQSPIKHLSCKDLALQAAQVYAANGILVHLFDSFRTTPELSFAIRYLKCIGGDMFSASHNPPDHNGKKVYDQHGGQLVPPEDEALVHEVTQNVTSIKTISYHAATQSGLIQPIPASVDHAYLNAVSRLSLSKHRHIKIAFTPLHGCSSTSILPLLTREGFDIHPDPHTSNPSGKFENVTFHIPNPEVVQSFDSVKRYADQIKADLIINSDPDGDRLGIMVRHHHKWHFVNGNQISAILTEYVISRKKPSRNQGIVIKTDVTTNLITSICHHHHVKLIGDLLVGFKYIGQIMNQLESQHIIDHFLIGCEESHGYIAGNYSRDKDGALAALWLCELAARLKTKNQTLIDYLNHIYVRYGYFRNYLTEIRLPGAQGMSQIKHLQTSLRHHLPTKFGTYQVDHSLDWQNRRPIVSNTDKISKNGLVFYFVPQPNTQSIRITIRPSGTEPKIKIYFEIGSLPFKSTQLPTIQQNIESLLQNLEIEFMSYCYQILEVDFPKRGFLLFWQLPLRDKLHYFHIEPHIAKLKSISTRSIRDKKLHQLIHFLDSNPTLKVNRAFKQKYGQTIEDYLDLS